MLIPSHWSEARETRSIAGRQRTLRRWGWSSDSREAAEAHADQRLDQAFAKLAAGEQVATRERSSPYNGAEGMPIREEVIERFDDAVITRNSYGALCLNTPDIGFADIDLPEGEAGCAGCLLFLGLLAGGGAFALQMASWPLFGLAFVVATIIGVVVHHIQAARSTHTQILAAELAEERLAAFAADHPDWHLRLYRSPNGYRVMVMHAPLDPAGPETETFFAALGTDPLYVAMCRRQRCFRARISPKPWRCGITDHMTPRGCWPIPEEGMAEREAWIKRYNQAAEGYASCHFLRRLGSERLHPKADMVRAVHDKLCQSDSDLPMA
jgi:hypothetical protein